MWGDELQKQPCWPDICQYDIWQSGTPEPSPQDLDGTSRRFLVESERLEVSEISYDHLWQEFRLKNSGGGLFGEARLILSCLERGN